MDHLLQMPNRQSGEPRYSQDREATTVLRSNGYCSSWLASASYVHPWSHTYASRNKHSNQTPIDLWLISHKSFQSTSRIENLTMKFIQSVILALAATASTSAAFAPVSSKSKVAGCHLWSAIQFSHLKPLYSNSLRSSQRPCFQLRA